MSRLSLLLLLSLTISTGCAPTKALQNPTEQAVMLPVCVKKQNTILDIIGESNFYVFFDQHSASLTPRAKTTIDYLAKLGANDRVQVTITGGKDRSEILPMDRNLIARRTEAVRAYLAEVASPDWTLSTNGSPIVPTVQTAPGVAEPQNREVWLLPRGIGQQFFTFTKDECWHWLRQQCIEAGPKPPGHACTAAASWIERHVIH